MALIGTGTTLASMVLAGFLLGYVLDGWLGTLPVFMLGLGCLGFIGGILNIYKLLSQPQK